MLSHYKYKSLHKLNKAHPSLMTMVTDAWVGGWVGEGMCGLTRRILARLLFTWGRPTCLESSSIHGTVLAWSRLFSHPMEFLHGE